MKESLLCNMTWKAIHKLDIQNSNGCLNAETYFRYSNEQLHVKLSDGCLDFWALMMIEAYAILKYSVFWKYVGNTNTGMNFIASYDFEFFLWFIEGTKFKSYM